MEYFQNGYFGFDTLDNFIETVITTKFFKNGFEQLLAVKFLDNGF
jgi:hypothetical protein